MKDMGNEVEIALYLSRTTLIIATLGWTHKSKATGDSRHRIIFNRAPQSGF